jgi:hypothetical protein
MIFKLRPNTTLLRGLCFLLVLAAVPVCAQISFNDFSDVSNVALNGSAAQVTNEHGQKVLRLTPDGGGDNAGTAWFKTQRQSVAAGFTSVFQFQIVHDPAHGPGPADGLAFVIQNSSGEGQGTEALGGSGSGIGYGAPDEGQHGTPIPNSLAVEFDTYQNLPYDPNDNHIAIQSCGTDPNTQHHDVTCPSGEPSNLGIVSDLAGIHLADGTVHTAVVEYDPPSGGNRGILRVFLDNFGTPILVANANLTDLLSLMNNDSAWVGFTGATGAYVENNDILKWTFTPATAETQISQDLTPDTGEPTDTNYQYGSYNHKVEYQGANAGDHVTVTAIPVGQQDFHDHRLAGTPFAGAQCVIYEGTGGRCTLFEVSCSNDTGNDCTDLNYDLFNNFNTDQIITGACVLKAPIDTNQWQNIIKDFTQTRNDPGTHSGSKGFSDFILAQNCTAPPGITISSPVNGATYFVGQTIPVTYGCTVDPNAPLVSLTSCDGTLNGHPVTSGSNYTFTQADLGAGSMSVSASDSVLNTSSKNASFTVVQGPLVSLSPASIDFGNVPLLKLLWQNLKVTNVGGAPLKISKVYLTLGNADRDDYFFLNLCPSQLPAGKSCYITVFFWADDLGTRTATLNLADNAPNSPQGVPLTANVVKKGR